MDDRWPTPSAAPTTTPAPSPVDETPGRRPTRFVAPGPLHVAAFNRLERDAAIALVQPCFAVERWWTALVDARPYADHESLLDVARRAADPLSQHELDLALAAYLDVRPDDWLPAPGARPGGEDLSPTALLDRIAEDGRAYRARFGRPFVIRTAGRSTAEIAAHLRRRTDSDAATEDRATAAALRQIGLLSLVRRIAA